MKRILTLLALSASMLAAQTDRWVPFFAGSTGDTGYFDNETIRYSPSDDQYATAWVRVVESSGAYGILHIQVHATTRHARTLSFVKYDANHQQIDPTASYSATPWSDIVPESLADVLLNRLYRPKAPVPPAVRYE
uniref:Uncharacterized protein n=1 Tax=Solibacter usitatus (strain Ellin6076) TaxID=234267 RepID=Q01TQ8_SOLUE